MPKPVPCLAAVLTLAAATSAGAACEGPEHRQFDFWVGDWDVLQTGGAQVVGRNLIEKVYGGCGVRENWMPAGGGGGGSLNIYTQAAKGWTQAWIDSQGTLGMFKGGWNGRAMVIEGAWPRPDGVERRVRMTYTPNADGTMRQAGEASLDGGKTWRPTFDFTYRRRG